MTKGHQFTNSGDRPQGKPLSMTINTRSKWPEVHFKRSVIAKTYIEPIAEPIKGWEALPEETREESL